MYRMTRVRLVRKCALLVVALAVVVYVCVLALGGVSDVLFAIAIGTAVAVAAFSDTRRGGHCAPRFLRRSRG